MISPRALGCLVFPWTDWLVVHPINRLRETFTCTVGSVEPRPQPYCSSALPPPLTIITPCMMWPLEQIAPVFPPLDPHHHDLVFNSCLSTPRVNKLLHDAVCKVTPSETPYSWASPGGEVDACPSST